MEEESNVSQNKNKEWFKKHFCTVTPVSRVLALTLFISLPFAGFWVGYNFTYLESIQIGKKCESEQGIPNAQTEQETQRDLNNKRATGTAEFTSFPIPVTCYQNSNFFVVEPVKDYDRTNATHFIIKEQLTSRFDRHVCEYMQEEEDYLIDNESGTGHVIALKNKYLILDYGTSHVRSLIVHDLETRKIVYQDIYNKEIDVNLDESGVTINYWRVVDDSIVVTKESCPEYFEYYNLYGGGAGFNELIQINLETLEEEVVGIECVYRE